MNRREDWKNASPPREKTGNVRWQTSRNESFGTNIRKRMRTLSPNAARNGLPGTLFPAIISGIEKLESLDPKYPPPKVDLSKIRIK